jgi:5-formyltetrahydrofolate cyclo-ligase
LPEQIDVLLVPGIAFDHQGNRLGRGKGYYDRFLRRLPATTLTIGVVFEAMIRPRIPHAAHDHPIKMVITENRMMGEGMG